MFKQVHFAYKNAHEIIWKQGCWKYLFIPILLSFALAILLLTLCFWFSADLGEILLQLVRKLISLPDWLKPFFTFIAFSVCLGTSYILFRNLVMVLYGPFLDDLSETSEKLITGESSPIDTSLLDSIKRPAFLALIMIPTSVLILIISFIIGLIPIIGFIISTALMLFSSLCMSSIPCLDPYFERKGVKLRDTIKLIWRNKGIVLYFGLIGFIITSVPIIGWFLGPTYSVVAGIVVAIQLYEKSTPIQP